MMRVIRWEGQRAESVICRASAPTRDVTEAVARIMEDVAARGDEAALDCCERFDGARPDPLVVPLAELGASLAAVEPGMLATLRLAAGNIERFHARQRREGFVDAKREGVVLGQRILPLHSVGLYIPGGTARYPSSVLMNAIPARLAGVERIVMTTPPDRDGRIPAMLLAAAKLAGVDEVVRLGGAQAVAALAYGTQSVPRVDKIVGPGNIYVTTAKQLAFSRGLCAIDMVAGPSEVLLIADAASDPVHVAADLLSQAEHDRLSAAWLVTDSMALALATQAEVERQLPALSREAIARASIEENGRIIVVDSLQTAAAVANDIAPEHLELCVEDPFAMLPLIRNAASVFLGRYCPEPLGDYLAGPNHTLPTNGTARYASPLGVDDFCKRSSFIYYTKAALADVGEDVRRFALREGLDAHANAVAVRVPGGGGEDS